MKFAPVYTVNAVAGNFDPDRNYDINVAILIHYSRRYAYRLNSLKRCGLVNHSKHRVHVTLLASKGDAEYANIILNNWPTGIDVTLLELNSIDPVPKINGYYLWLNSSKLRARWHMRVDDDSVTDVSALLSIIDRRFHGMPIHLMNNPSPENTYSAPIFSDYASSQGLRLATTLTEYESSVSSHAAMSSVFSSPEAMKFLEDTAAAFVAPGDRSLAIAMHIAQTPVAGLPTLSRDFLKAAFSLCGGGVSHIHYVDWADNRFFEILEAFEYGTFSPLTDRDVESLKEDLHEFGRCLGEPLAAIALLPDGTIHGSNHAHEKNWRVADGRLYFTTPEGYITTVFQRMLRFEDRVFAIGDYLHDSVLHYIRIN